ncbi:MAG: hypothetical protein CM15mP32_4920 [Flavobacteriaceae bacterium]|nr:MAG: hypothetical protein CM15mP32_4920 [Flavobacteriaceae bacterium]
MFMEKTFFVDRPSRLPIYQIVLKMVKYIPIENLFKWGRFQTSPFASDYNDSDYGRISKGGEPKSYFGKNLPTSTKI